MSYRLYQELSLSLPQGENTITNPSEVANVFNNYFVTVADTAKQKIN